MMAELFWRLSFALSFLAVLASQISVGEAQSGICYRSTTRSRTSYRSDGYSDYYSCGFLWLSRCSRTRYRSVSYTTYYTASVFDCCSGYTSCGSSSCCPICDEDCQNGGTCISPNTCGCTPAWTNATCETDVDECNDTALNYCDHYCMNSIGSYNCSCDDGYRLSSDGHTCLDIDECTEGTDACDDLCHNTNGSYYCSCSGSGYRLQTDNVSCENINECEEEIDTCVQDCTDTEGGYNCSCGSGYTLANDSFGCDDVDECAANLDDCEQTCQNIPGSFTCGCNPGYALTSDARTCQDVDECSDGSHQCSQNCHNSIGSYICTCTGNFIINGPNCIDIDECAENNGGCSDTCTNNDGSFSCSCNPGYELDVNERICRDTNECTSGTARCSQGCNNTVGSYSCSCNLGYRLSVNEYQCNEINECEEETVLCEQICINTNGSYNCQCRDGYRINSDQMTCTDIDECDEETHQCTQNCMNSNGSYACTCNSGFIIDADGRTCDDMNECSDGSHTCQQVCNNTHGSYHCLCYQGYQLNSDSFTCRDVDECATDVDGCDQTCHNNIGSYTCSCNSGFRLNGDGLHCDDINECTSNTHTCTESQICVNTDGSFMCTCSVGYVLNSDGSACYDLDECATGQNSCEHNCNNTEGSYTCSCNNGYFLNQDGLHCSDIDECALELDQCEQICVNLNGSYTCECSDGYQTVTGRYYACEDIDECSPEFNWCEQVCENTIGSYTCSCLPGYSKTSDQLSCLGQPVNVTLSSRSSRSFEMSWNFPVNFSERHGDVVSSPITCNSQENPRRIISVSAEGDLRETVIESLVPYNTYNCCLSIMTTLANSSMVCRQAQTPEAVPGSPPTAVVLDNGSPYNITVTWNPPQSPNGIITRYIVYVGYENGTVDVFYVNGVTTTYNVTNLLPFQIIYVEVSASTSIGEGPRTTRIEVQTAPAPPSQVNNVAIEVLSNTSILVKWDPPTRPNGVITYYDVIVFNERTGFNFSRATHEQEVSVEGLQEFVPYTVQLFASTAAGRGDPVTTITFTNHGVPIVPSLSSVKRLSAISARINWVPLTPDEAKGILTLLQITYEPVRVKDCTTFLPMDSEVVFVTEQLFEQSTAVISGLEPNKEYCVAIKVSTSGGESGFSNSMRIPLSKRVPFQIRFQLPDGTDCSTFVAVSSAVKLSDILAAISSAIAQECQCQYTTTFIANGRLMCGDDESEFIFQGELVTTDSKTADEIRNLTQDWVLKKPLVGIGNTMYQLNPYCSVVVDELGETSCDAISPTEPEPSTTSESPHFTLLEITSVTVMGFLFIVVVASILVICCLIIRMHKLRHGSLSTLVAARQARNSDNIYEVCEDDKDYEELDAVKVATTKMGGDTLDDSVKYEF